MTTATTHKSDSETVQDLLDSNPGMLWQYAWIRDHHRSAAHVRDNGSGWEVCLAGNNFEVLTYTYAEFAGRFELLGVWARPSISSQLDRILFQKAMAGAMA